MRQIYILLLVLLCGGSVFGQSESPLHESVIYGTLTVETFYGPPNYIEDPENDRRSSN